MSAPLQSSSSHSMKRRADYRVTRRVIAISLPAYSYFVSLAFCSVSGICIPSSLTMTSSLCPFFRLKPFSIGLGNTITELVPTEVMVTAYFTGILIFIHMRNYI
jgi:uncharacterized membrane protein